MYAPRVPEKALEPAYRAPVGPLRTASELAAAFLLGQSEPTLSAYRRDLEDFGEFLAGVGVEPLAARRGHLDAYVRFLEHHGARRSTVARRLSCLAGFYGYAVDEELIERSPLGGVRRPSIGEESQTLGLDRDETRALLAAAAEASARDRALVYLLCHLGLRVSEALTIDVSDLEATRGHRTVWVTRKGGVRRQLALSPPCAEAIDGASAGREPSALLVTRSGRRLDRHHAAKIVARLARTAGIDKRVTPHSLRHAFITHALDAGASLRDVQDAAGHADPRTTRRYDRSRHSLDRHPTYAVAAYLAD
jgi:integrase/recombinase XerD